MELILNTNELGYEPFLDTNINSIIIGLKNFCTNQPFSLSINQLPEAIKKIKSAKKNIYLSVNLFAREKDLSKIKKIVNKLKNMEIDGYIISDLGVLNIFKSFNLENKITLDLQTYVTNKYSAKSLLNMNISKVTLSKEITIEDIKEIVSFNCSKIELLCQGFYPITYSKRPILTCYFKQFKLRKKSSLYFIKEENRQNFYPLVETKNALLVYNDTQYCLFNHLEELINIKINALRIDSVFLTKEEITNYINFYSEGIRLLTTNKQNDYNLLKKEFNKKYFFDMPFLYNDSFLLKEGN